LLENSKIYINYINMFNFLKPQKQLMLATCSMLLACGFSSCSKYDLDENDPAGWGESIYSHLRDQGNFTNTTRLIDDLGLAEVLAKTGSKTVFAANDEAFQRFYASNEWGVKRYEDLSESQKCLLLKGSVINNSYQIDDLSSVEGPIEGQCMRRFTSQDAGDTLALVNVADLPNMDEKDWVNNPTWKKLKDEGLEKIYLLKDATLPPMMHFIEDYLANNKITNDDYNFLYNNKTSRIPGDASVNGVNIVQHNVKCSNGFVHIVEDVVQPLKNIAEIVNTKPQLSEWNSLLLRFAVPRRITDENRIRAYQNRPDRDFSKYRLYEQRFFSKKSQGGTALNTDDDNNVFANDAGLLKFDPGWNTYFNGVVTSSEEVAMQKNMGVMMVPSNAALHEYFTNQEGKVLIEEYGTLDKVPNDVIVELINNNMLSSFAESVPSKFDGILNDANDPMGVERSAIDSVWLGCNGAVYMTNRVYSPTAYVSVLYPAIVKSNLKVMRVAVEKCQYSVYLNSLNSRYSFFVPRNGALQSYIDPVSYGKSNPELCRFYYDEEIKDVRAYTRVINPDGSLAEDSTEILSEDLKRRRLQDILDNHIVIGDVEDGNEYYRTKGGQEIQVKNASMGAGGMTVAGSRQLNETAPVSVSYVYDQTKAGNGKVYILDEPIMTTSMNVMDMLEKMNQDHPNTCDKFRDLLKGSGLYETIRDQKYACIKDSNLSVFNSYHYTIYVPQNSSLTSYPTWEEVEALSPEDPKRAADSTKIMNMLLLHIQDGSLFIGSESVGEDGYETAMVDPETEKFVRVYAELTNSDIYVRKTQTSAKRSKVQKIEGTGGKVNTYNLMAREFVANGGDKETATGIQSSATAVIHLIDSPIE
jgi:uncharacterized surface protein with fasciclin (FAS1) repeats